MATPDDTATAVQPLIAEPPAVKSTVPPAGVGEMVAVSVAAWPSVGEADFVRAVVVETYGAIAVDFADGTSFVTLVRSVRMRK